MSQMSSSHSHRPPVTVWKIFDGKPGHINQTLGLVQALESRIPLRSHSMTLPDRSLAASILCGRAGDGRSLPDPDLIVGAGHRTHLSLLAARFWRGGRAVVLMRPSLPVSWFDLCVAPDHDGLPVRAGVFLTKGVLNTIRPGTGRSVERGLFLIGGPCRHAQWNDEVVARQVCRIVTAQPAVQWMLTTSRRTPATFLDGLAQMAPPNLRTVDYAQTDRDWVPAQLGRCGQVWVTPDSVSMVYEALTAGAATGLLDLPLDPRSKLVAALERLQSEGFVNRFHPATCDRLMTPPPRRLDEAARCAEWICNRWFATTS